MEPRAKRTKRALSALALLAALGPALPLACGTGDRALPVPGPELRLDDDPGSERFGTLLLGPLTGAEDEAEAQERLDAVGDPARDAFSVWTGSAQLSSGDCAHPATQPPMLGRLQARSRELQFEPRFPFVAGMTYTACVDLEALSAALPGWISSDVGRSHVQATFALPAVEARQRPQVTAVWPSSDPVPENLLRLYLHFSEPMSTRDVASRISLIDESGSPLSEPFVEIPNGLWDERATRLTLFFHPGRLKRGVGPRIRLGQVLHVGQTVRLRIEPTLESARGTPLGAPFERELSVGPVDRASPDPERWQVLPPPSPSGAVTVRFDEPLDRAQLPRFATVHHGAQQVAGEVTSAEDGSSWSFVPTQGWQAGRYTILARRQIEDLAGNTVDHLFDVETTDPRSAHSAIPVTSPGPDARPPLLLEFEVRFDPSSPFGTAR